jgi:hypothetical protein
MPAPTATVKVEPTVKGTLVYLPMAPLSPAGTKQGRILLELTITNSSSSNLTASTLVVTFPSGSPASRSINMTVPPFSSLLWAQPKPADHFLFDLASAPTSATLSVFFVGFSDPITVTLPVAAHTGPNPLGPYRFPSLSIDLALGEFWQVNGCSHDTGNHQAFAYDMGIWGTDHGPNAIYSPFVKGAATTNPPNSDYRIWGKPVRAMAAGEVIEIVNDCPNNPTPLYPEDPNDATEMQQLLDAQKPLWSPYTNGVAGNHVLVQHGDEIALYAHLQKGSIDSNLRARTPGAAGSPVSAGQILGRAGNSGNSTAPHLHIDSHQPNFGDHAAMPMVFTGAWTIDNDSIGGPGAPATTGDPAGFWVPLTGIGIPAGNPGQGYTGDCFLLPSGTPQWPEVVHYSVEENDYQSLWDAMDRKGMSPAWINTHTIEKGPFYFYTFFNVVFRPKLGRDEPTCHGLDAAQFSTLRSKLVDQQGYHVKQIESYFSMRQGKQLFAAIFAKYGGLAPRHPARTYHGKTYSEHASLASSWTQEGFVPTNMSVVSVNKTLSYTALWEFSPHTSFDMEEHLNPLTMQDTFDRNHKADRFTTYLKGYFHQGVTRYSAVFSSGTKDRKVRDDLRLNGFQTVLTQQRQDNHSLRSISGYQLDGDAAFAAIWE